MDTEIVSKEILYIFFAVWKINSIYKPFLFSIFPNIHTSNTQFNLENQKRPDLDLQGKTLAS